MTDTKWTLKPLAELLKKDNRSLSRLCKEISKWDKRPQAELSAADGAVLLLAANAIAEGGREDVPTAEQFRHAVKIIIVRLHNNTTEGNRLILFKVIDALINERGFLMDPDVSTVCNSLIQNALSEPEVKEERQSDESPEQQSDESPEEPTSQSANETKSVFSARSLLDQEFWAGSDQLGDKLMQACILSEGFESIRSKKSEELPYVLFPASSSASIEKTGSVVGGSKKLTSLCQSVECALVLFNLHAVWSADEKISMKNLEELVILSSDSAVASAYAANCLVRVKNASSEPANAPAPPPEALEEEASPETFVDLVRVLGCAPPKSGQNIHRMMSTTVSVVKTALKVWNSPQSTASQQSMLPEHIPKNIRWVILHHLLNGLSPAICRENWPTELPKHVKFSGFMLEMLRTFCDLLGSLMDDVGKEEDPGTMQMVKWDQFSICDHYHSKMHLYMLNLLSAVPLLDLVVCTVDNSCREMLSQTGVLPAATAAQGSSSDTNVTPPANKEEEVYAVCKRAISKPEDLNSTLLHAPCKRQHQVHPQEASSTAPTDPPIKRLPFLELAEFAMKCLHNKFTSLKTPAVREFLTSGVSVNAVESLSRVLVCVYTDKNLSLVKDLAELSTLRDLTSSVLKDLVLAGLFANKHEEALDLSQQLHPFVFKDGQALHYRDKKVKHVKSLMLQPVSNHHHQQQQKLHQDYLKQQQQLEQQLQKEWGDELKHRKLCREKLNQKLRLEQEKLLEQLHQDRPQQVGTDAFEMMAGNLLEKHWQQQSKFLQVLENTGKWRQGKLKLKQKKKRKNQQREQKQTLKELRKVHQWQPQPRKQWQPLQLQPQQQQLQPQQQQPQLWQPLQLQPQALQLQPQPQQLQPQQQQQLQQKLQQMQNAHEGRQQRLLNHRLQWQPE